MAATPTGKGYWLWAAAGGIFCFGDAKSYGSVQRHVSSPIVAHGRDTDGQGLLAVRGRRHLLLRRREAARLDRPASASTKPIVDMCATPSGKGYWL